MSEIAFGIACKVLYMAMQMLAVAVFVAMVSFAVLVIMV